MKVSRFGFPPLDEQEGSIIVLVLIMAVVMGLLGVSIFTRVEKMESAALWIRGKSVILNQRRLIQFDLSTRRLPEPL